VADGIQKIRKKLGGTEVTPPAANLETGTLGRTKPLEGWGAVKKLKESS